MQTMVPLYGFGGVPYSAVRKAAPRNLLDNSDFRNPVDQRGQDSYTGAVYTIDRWKTFGSADKTVTLNNGIILPAGIYDFGQPILNSVFTAGKTYTFAVMTDTGKVGIISTTHEGVHKQTAVPLGDTGLAANIIYMWTSDITLFALQNTGTSDVRIICAALYEGEYTAETLPVYQPKGYGAELAECMRYYQRYNTVSAVVSSSWGTYAGTYLLSIPMRISYYTINVYDTNGNIGQASIVGGTNQGESLAVAHVITQNTVSVYPTGSGVSGQTIRYDMELSADL